MREQILKRINQIKQEENNFESSWWLTCFVTVDYDKTVFRLCQVDFEKLTDEELIRLFEYLIRQQCDAVEARINQTYFKY